MEEVHVFQGMRRDNHPIRQDKNFLWDALNIRLTNRDDNTLISITNEKGTSSPLLTFQGTYVGHCVLGKYLVVFTATNEGYNYIYRIEEDKSTNRGYNCVILFCTQNGTWSSDYPIEAIGIYETEFIQKVYWVDGKNQPRVINIVKPEYKLSGTKYEGILGCSKWDYSNIAPGFNNNSVPRPSGIDLKDWEKLLMEFKTEFPSMYSETSLDFVQTLTLRETVDVFRSNGSGMFSPGTVQYALSYYNKYGQETNIFYVTPLQYVSPVDRGGSPEESVSNLFNIEIKGIDNFDYIRVYSIHRTSIDAVPTVKVVEDIPTRRNNAEDAIVCVDDGTKGYIIDPTQLLYIGGRSIIAGTITHKDNTLFLGDITINENAAINDIVKSCCKEELVDTLLPNVDVSTTTSTFYSYTSPLGRGNLAGFKSSEKYRCGVQVQTKDGVWSNPIYIDDYILCSQHPMLGRRESKGFVFENLDKLKEAGVKKIRACVVFPRTYERDVICQGILCPTVFSAAGRRSNTPYVQSSWFFRPTTNASINKGSNAYRGASIQYEHNKSLFIGGDRNAEIQNMVRLDSSTSDNGVLDFGDEKVNDNYELIKSYYFVDENIVTFHSPDIEFDTQLQNIDWSNTTLKIIGLAKLGAISGDIDIQTSSPTASGSGFTHTTVGYKTNSKDVGSINGGLVSGLFYESGLVYDNFEVGPFNTFLVYPWHRSGSLNNDSVRPDTKGTRTAVLSKKVISNLKFFSENLPLSSGYDYDISTPKIFNSNEMSMLKIEPSYLNSAVTYLGNVDTLITSGQEYNFYVGTNVFSSPIDTLSINDTLSEKEVILKSKDPVRMKYKSTPHIVFSLSGKSRDIPLLPSHINYNSTLSGEPFTFPRWQDIGSNDGSGNTSNMYDKEFAYIDCNVLTDTSGDLYALNKYAFEKVENGYTILKCNENANGELTWDTPTIGEGEVFKITFSTELGKHSDYELPGGLPTYGNIKYVKAYKTANTSSGGIYELYRLEEYIESQEEIESRAGQPISYTLSRKTFRDTNLGAFPYLLLAEITRKVEDDVKFGGKSDSAIQQNLWIPAGDPVPIPDDATSITVPFEYGDTWYSRYDCLKTYPFTHEDENQIVEIGSFLCETRVNIDGRYDKNRGLTSNLDITPQNFNLLNEVYSQKDNFFNYRVLDRDSYKQQVFGNQITWSKEKSIGEDIDTWTSITLANTLNLGGDRGKITALKAWNDALLCFQEKALNHILFNSRVQIPVSDGVPVEISNGYKVDGSRVISNTIGCSNKWTIVNTSVGIYFIDSNTDNLYLFNNQLTNLSGDRGMDWWVRQNHGRDVWRPTNLVDGKLNGIRTFYDNKYGDIYFTPGPVCGIDQPDALCYSEKLAQFTSLMSYGGTQAMFNFADGFYSLRESDDGLSLYQNNVGEYNNFYDVPKEWRFSFISNDNPTMTKIFDTIELRTDHYLPGSTIPIPDSFPMSYIQVSDEYQNSGIVQINERDMRKKFRIWRGLLPRHEGGRQRIRNPWAMITLGWEPSETESNNKMAIIHDVTVKYTI